MPVMRRVGNRIAGLCSTLGRVVADLILPRVCVVCEMPMPAGATDLACGLCWGRLPLLPNPQCMRCGHPAADGSCRWCPLLPSFVRAARSVCWVGGGVGERMVYALKYEGWRAIGLALGHRMARLPWPVDVLHERTCLIPVPLAASRERERGFNQSAILCAGMSRVTGLPVWADVVQRARVTSSQTRLTPEQRLTNVAGAFRIIDRSPSRLHGAHVILVDDVVTTAATLNECASALWLGGARIISYVTFGRARAAGDRPLSRGRTHHGN